MTRTPFTKAVLFCLLTLTTVPAWAEWTLLGNTANGAAAVYIDLATIRKDGALRRVWSMQDLNQADNFGDMSRRTLNEYDCKEEKRRLLSVTTFVGPMLSGRITSSSSIATEWAYSAPGTLDKTILDTVCSR